MVRRKAGLNGEELAAWFWSNVDQTAGPDACWLWAGNRGSGKGYGILVWGGRHQGAHRVALGLADGPVPPGLCVLHSCDNPPCCNPAHLRAGTQGENIRDAIAKGRARYATGDASGARLHPETRARGERHGSRTKPEAVLRGGANGQSKLREEHIPVIFAAYRLGETAVSLAKRFGVGRCAIDCVLHGKTWRHVAPDEPRIPVRPYGAR